MVVVGGGEWRNFNQRPRKPGRYHAIMEIAIIDKRAGSGRVRREEGTNGNRARLLGKGEAGTYGNRSTGWVLGFH